MAGAKINPRLYERCVGMTLKALKVPSRFWRAVQAPLVYVAWYTAVKDAVGDDRAHRFAVAMASMVVAGRRHYSPDVDPADGDAAARDAIRNRMERDLALN